MSQRSGKRPTSLFRQIYEIPYNDSHHKIKLYNCAKGSLNMVQRLSIHKKLPIHNGCVNCICWSQNGEYLLSGSDDHHLVVTNAMKNFKTEVRYQTNHRANIFNAKFLPNRSYTSVISCSGDGLITFSDLNVPVLPSQLSSDINCFSCHSGTVYELATVPHDPNTFLSAGEDDTVRCFDLRVKSSCHKMLCKDDILIQCQRAVTAISINEAAPYQLAIGTSDSTVRIFDRRMMGTIADGYSARNTRPVVLFTAPGLDTRAYRITSVAFSPDGHEVLASYSSEYLYLFDIRHTSSAPLGEGPLEGGGGGDKEVDKACPVRRLRLRGDWSDTGPHARPEREVAIDGESNQARASVHLTVMQRMTDLLTRILNDPMTRAAIAAGDRDPAEQTEQDSNVSEAESEASSSHPPETLGSAERDDTMDIEPSTSGSCDQTKCGLCNSPLPTNEMPSELPTSSEEDTTRSDETCTSLEQTIVPTEQSITHLEQIPTPLEQTSLTSEQSPSVLDQTPTPSEQTPSSSQIFCARCSAKQSSSVPSSSTGSERMAEMMDVPRGSSSVPSKSDDVPTQPVPYVSTESSAGNSGLDFGRDITVEAQNVVNKESLQSGVLDNEDPTMISSGSLQPKTSTSSPMLPSTTSNLSEPSSSSVAGTSSASKPGAAQASVKPPEYNMDIDQSSEDEAHLMEEDLMAAEESLQASSHNAKPPKKRRGAGFCDEYATRGTLRRKFTGHRNARTMIKQARFWGDGFVMSGSDCGHVFIWDRSTGALANCLEADSHVVNCVLPHPSLPLLATSGIDYDVKIWEPRLEEAGFDLAKAEELIKRNEIMLEETKDTITVPASFMIRMLACLNQIRRGGALNRAGRRNPSDSTE